MNEIQNLNNQAPVSEPNTDLTSSVRNLWAAINKVNAKSKELIAENKEFKLRAGEIEKLWKRYNELKEQTPKLLEKAAITDSLIEANNILKKDNFNLKKLVDELKEIEKNFSLAQNEFAAKNKALFENASIINSLKEKISQLEIEISDKNSKLASSDQLNEKYEKMRAESEMLRAESEKSALKLKELSKDNEDFIDEIEKISDENIKLKQDNESLSNRLIINEDNLKKNEAEIIESKNRISEYNKLREENQCLKQHNQELDNELTSFSEKNNKISDELEQIKIENITFKGKIIELEKEINEKYSNAENASAKEKELAAKIEELELNNNDLTAQIEKLKFSIKLKDDELLKISEKLNDRNSENLPLNIENKDELIEKIDKYIDKLEKIL